MPHLPRKVPRRPRRQIRTKRATQYHEYHACHAKMTVDLSLCHGCYVKRRWMSPSARLPRAPHSTMSATPATQNGGGCEFEPRLPRETKVDVTKCRACHAKCRGAPGNKSGPSAPHSTISTTPATRSDGGCEFVPHLPRETKVNDKCHACRAKGRGATRDKSGPSAPHSTMSATPGRLNDDGCELCATPAATIELRPLFIFLLYK